MSPIRRGGGPGLIAACPVSILRRYHVGVKEIVKVGQLVGETFRVEDLRGFVERGEMRVEAGMKAIIGKERGALHGGVFLIIGCELGHW